MKRTRYEGWVAEPWWGGKAMNIRNAGAVIRSGPAPTGNEPSVAERYNRLRKAIALADLLDASGITSALAQVASAEDWKLAASQCVPPVNAPSVETQRQVVELLTAREAARARMVRK